jgi:hypothetical protein
MKEIIKHCIIARYDSSIKEAPFLTIPIDKVDVLEPQDTNDGGVEFAFRLSLACVRKGYFMKFYSMSDEEGVDYEINVE